VLYLALGPYRIRAALAHTAALARSGADVQLLVPDRREWREALDGARPGAGPALAPGVAVTRVGGGPQGPLPASAAFWRRARAAAERLRAETAPDLVVAGDPHAVPLAYRLARGRRRVRLAFEPALPPAAYGEPGSADPVRPSPAGTAGPGDTAVDHLAIVTPWYPSPNNPFAGAFVRAAAEAAAPRARRISVLHGEDWTGPGGGLAGDLVRTALDRLEAEPGGHDFPGGLLRTPVPVFPGQSFADMGEAHVRALAAALPGGRIDADVVHGHVALHGGLVAARLARPGARVVVTEHATYLRRLMRFPAARALYREVLERADAFLCVGEQLRGQLSGYFPDLAEKIQVVPNAIGFGAIPAAARPSPALSHWLYVGRLVEHKNVATLVEAFAVAAQEDPAARLTLVGSGDQEPVLRERVRALGLEDRVEFTGPLPAEGVVARMHAADLLVHPSKRETFGVTVVEAVAAGLPVLATRSGGPEETLAGLEGVAGALVDVSEDPAVLLDGHRLLRAEFGSLDLARAREVLDARYGHAAVGARLAAAYGLAVPAPEEPAMPVAAAEAVLAADVEAPEAEVASAPAPAVAPGPAPLDRVVVAEGDEPAHVLLLAVNHSAPRRVVAYAHWLLARGVRVTMVSVRAEHWRALGMDPRVEIRTLKEAEGRHPLPRGERLLVKRAPRAVIRRARAQVQARDRTRPLELAVGAVERAHLRGADLFHRRVFMPGYRVVRPYLLGQVGVPRLKGVDLEAVDLLVAADSSAVALGWQIARRHPGLRATTAMDRELFAHRAVTDPAIDPDRRPDADDPESPDPGEADAPGAASGGGAGGDGGDGGGGADPGEPAGDDEPVAAPQG